MWIALAGPSISDRPEPLYGRDGHKIDAFLNLCQLVLSHHTGLKRHSVTLFEGGRVAGEAIMAELLDELWQSYEAGQVC